MSRWTDRLGLSERRWRKRPDEEIRPAKTAWDWLELAVVPAMLALIAIAFNASQATRERKREDARANEQRRIALDATRADALQAYLRQMSELMLDRRLLRSKQGSDVRAVAHAATLTVLRRLDGRRKAQVVAFLTESLLIATRYPHRGCSSGADCLLEPKISLEGADLRGMIARGADLSTTNFAGSDLSDAVFDDALLAADSFAGAQLQRASFKGANLELGSFAGSNLKSAVFDGANLHGAALSSTCVTDTSFRQADLSQSNWSAAEGLRVDFTDARVEGWTDLASAALVDVQLGGASAGDPEGAPAPPRLPADWSSRGARATERDRERLCEFWDRLHPAR